jgi:hypothetical protein
MSGSIRTPKESGSENALRDGNNNHVTLIYDEENDVIKMARSDTDGVLKVIGHVRLPDGTNGPISGVKQNNEIQLVINDDAITDHLKSIDEQLRIISFHLGNITDMQIEKEDMT